MTSLTWREHQLLDASSDLLTVHDADGTVRFANAAAHRLLGMSPSELTGQNPFRLLHPDDRDAVIETMLRLLDDPRGAHPFLVRARHRDGRWLYLEAVARNQLSDPAVAGVVVSSRNVTQRIGAEEALAEHAVLLRSVLDALPAQTAVLDQDGCVVEVNHAWVDFSQERGGAPATTGPGVSFFAVCEQVVGEEAAEAQAAARGLQAVLDGQIDEYVQDVICRLHAREPLFFALQIVPLRRPEGGAVLTYTDITARRALEAEAAHRAMHDELTGLPNRALLLDRIEHALLERNRDDLALLFIDLDHFKLVNDGYGHAAGDEVLRELARRLQAAVRPADTVARLAGDEFVVLCERLPFLTEASRVAQRMLASIAQPFHVSGTQLSLGASVGIAAAEDAAVTADELLQAADQAMFAAKARGRNQFALYDDGIHQRSTRRVAQALSLRRLLEEDRLTVHYQPMVDLRDGRLAGVEALLRWHPDGEAPDTTPDAALSVALAEESGLIADIGGRVLRQALHQAAGFRRSDGSLLPLSVNLAAQQLEPSLVDVVVEAAGVAAYPLSSLTLELTERSVMTDVAASVQVLRELRALGVQIAVDDFGVGYSSLAYLRDLPLDTLKIDRAFVGALSHDSRDDRIISAIIQLGQALDLQVVAEGIEREQQRTRLLHLGCSLGQGYLFSGARPAEHFML